MRACVVRAGSSQARPRPPACALPRRHWRGSKHHERQDRRQGARFHAADRRRRQGHAWRSSRAARSCSISIPRTTPRAAPPRRAAFAMRFPDFRKIDATVIGISRDSVASHDKFKKKYDLPFALAADTEGQVCGLFGVWVQEEHVRAEIHGDRALDLPHRRQRHRAQGMAEGESAGPRRGSDGGARGAVNVSLADAACTVLRAPDPADKVALTQRFAAELASGALDMGGAEMPPDRPARPARPELKAPRDMPRRRAAGSPAGRIGTPPCARAYRAERHRSRLGPHRALRRRDAARLPPRLGRRRRGGGEAFRAACRPARGARGRIRRSAGA